MKDPKSKWLILINMYPFPHANSLVHLLDFKIVPYALQLQQRHNLKYGDTNGLFIAV